MNPKVKWPYLIPIIGVIIAHKDEDRYMTEEQSFWLLAYHAICGTLIGIIIGLIFRMEW